MTVGGATIVINNRETHAVRFSPIVPVLAANILAAYTIYIFKFGEEIDSTLFGLVCI